MDAFLDSTAVVELLFKDRVATASVRKILEDFDIIYTSQYVRMEIKRGVLDYFVCLHNKAVQCKNLSEVQAYIARLSSTPKRNKLSTILGAVRDFYRDFERNEIKLRVPGIRTTEFEKHMLAAFLRTRIRKFWTSFEKLVDIIIDSVECYKHGYTLGPPVLVGAVFDNTFENCDKYKPGICRLREFCNTEGSNLLAIQSELRRPSGADLESQKRLQGIKEICRNPKREIPRKLCWRAGDAIIVLEAPDGSVIVNGNCKHFDPLCKVVGKVSLCYKTPI